MAKKPTNINILRAAPVRHAIKFRDPMERRECLGKYVCAPAFNIPDVIRDPRTKKPIADKDPIVVVGLARELGYEKPVIMFISDDQFVYSFQACDAVPNAGRLIAALGSQFL